MKEKVKINRLDKKAKKFLSSRTNQKFIYSRNQPDTDKGRDRNQPIQTEAKQKHTLARQEIKFSIVNDVSFTNFLKSKRCLGTESKYCSSSPMSTEQKVFPLIYTNNIC